MIRQKRSCIATIYAQKVNRYAKAVRNKITKDCHILWKEIQDEIHRHINFTAQHWVDEYERIWK